MSPGLPLLPVYIVDVLGSSLMIVMALLAVRYARRLTRLDPGSMLWSFLFWVCMALVAFALSRSVGHILRFALLAGGYPDVWQAISSYSGGFNSITFIAVAALTFYFHNVYGVLERVRHDTRELARAHGELGKAHARLRELNQTLEERVEERTRELARSELKFRRLYESSKDMIFFCDGDQRLSDINDSGLEMLGYGERQLVVGKPLAIFFREEEQWSRYFCQLNSTGHVKDFEVEFLKQDGTPLYLLVTATAICEGGQGMQGCEVIAKDMTHFREVTEQLIRSENLASLGKLAAGVAHEINNPLTGILTNASLMLEDLPPDDPRRPDLQTIVDETLRCRTIVKGLLDFARQTQPQKTTLSLNKVVEDVLALVRNQASFRNIALRTALDPSLPPVMADQDQMRQVVLNIVLNASEAMAKGGELHIASLRDPQRGRVEVSFRDTGPGIPDDVKARLFEPFFTTKATGTGLGLSIAYGILERHGGEIRADSSTGHGTIITLALPEGPHGG